MEKNCTIFHNKRWWQGILVIYMRNATRLRFEIQSVICFLPHNHLVQTAECILPIYLQNIWTESINFFSLSCSCPSNFFFHWIKCTHCCWLVLTSQITHMNGYVNLIFCSCDTNRLQFRGGKTNIYVINYRIEFVLVSLTIYRIHKQAKK